MSPRRPRVPPLRGSVAAPGDKSITHRALILGALARGTTVVDGANAGADVGATIACLRSLGVTIAPDEPNGHLEVEGRDGVLDEPTAVLDAANSGTTLRLLAGVCAGIEGLSVLTGDASLRGRPMLRVVEPLRRMGAAIDGRKGGDLAPLVIRGGTLGSLEWTQPVASAQVKSALLLAALGAHGTVTVTEPGPSRDHTEVMLEAMGVALERRGTSTAVTGPQVPAAVAIAVPGDFSSALYLIVAATVIPGSDLDIGGVGLNPTRTAALDVLRRMGATVEIEEDAPSGGERRGRVRVRAAALHATEVEPGEVPRLVDDVPALAVAATQAEGTTVFHGVGELRVKESDRLAALEQELTKIGARVEAGRDTLAVHGPTPLHAAVVESHGDHRVALSLAVAGIATGANVKVQGWSCTQTSFPEFLDVLRRARGGRR